ncbi:MAG: glycerol-3-phosphate dehydrogenase/oxidase [Gammaproteobacteria bacterium]
MYRNFSQLFDRHFDVLICGGGIYGAWTAYDASLRGLKVAIVDQGDWACATSSASSKLIHGGLRYLESLDFTLVRKTLAERQMLLSAAAHRVWPLRFGIPVYRDSRIGSLRLRIGLILYDLLAGNVPEDHKYRRYSGKDFSGRFPFLRAEGLLAGFSYLDSQTDDSRFVLELIDGAQQCGAVCVNYCQVAELVETDGKVVGALVKDAVTGQSGTVSASQFVNAAGRWASSVGQESRSYRLSKGIHLIMPQTVSNEALLLTAKSDGRVFFMIPWYGLTLVGTTDTNYSGDLDRLSVEQEEIDYLLTEVNDVLKDTRWTNDDIIGRFAGLRVLKMSPKQSPSDISRDWELMTSGNGVLTSVGGKLTSARADAEIIVDRVCSNLGRASRGSTFGKPFPWRPEGDYRQWSEQQLNRASACGIDDGSAKWLLCRHGNRVGEVFQMCRNQPDMASRIVPEAPFIAADFMFCARSEMVVHLDDLLRRRLPLLILTKIPSAALKRLAVIAGKELNWDEERVNLEYQSCRLKWIID